MEIKKYDNIGYNSRDLFIIWAALYYYGLNKNSKFAINWADILNDVLNDKSATADIKIKPKQAVIIARAVDFLMHNFKAFSQKYNKEMSNDDFRIIHSSLPSLIARTRKYAHACVKHNTIESVSDIYKRLNKDCRIAKHSFVREALDNLFYHTTYNVKAFELYCSDEISKLAVSTINKKPFGENKSFCNLNWFIYELSYQISINAYYGSQLAIETKNLQMMKNALHSGIKYALIDVNNNDKITNIHKVTVNNFLYLIKEIKHSYKNNNEKAA